MVYLILALGAGAHYKAVCQKLASCLTVQLLYGLLHQLPLLLQGLEDALEQPAIASGPHQHISCWQKTCCCYCTAAGARLQVEYPVLLEVFKLP